jgi:hypothetical protein
VEANFHFGRISTTRLSELSPFQQSSCLNAERSFDNLRESQTETALTFTHGEVSPFRAIVRQFIEGRFATLSGYSGQAKQPPTGRAPLPNANVLRPSVQADAPGSIKA